jgi:hypothetical protein
MTNISSTRCTCSHFACIIVTYYLLCALALSGLVLGRNQMRVRDGDDDDDDDICKLATNALISVIV